MNCNTTHYRANSSSVPGDPTWAFTGGDDGLLAEAGLDAAGLADALASACAPPGLDTRRLMERATEGRRLGELTVLDLLGTVALEPGHPLWRRLAEAGLDLERLARNVAERRREEAPRPRARAGGERGAVDIGAFTRDLTAEAATDASDDIVDRPELGGILETLGRRHKRNVLLTGPAGSGKTSLVEGLARRVRRGEIPALAGARIVELHVGNLVAGMENRGSFEERFTQFTRWLEAFAESGERVIVFVDEAHALPTAGAATDVQSTAGTMLKPLLARGGVSFICATTDEESRRFIETDQAFSRRFQEVRLAEPTGALLERIVGEQARALERHHGITIPQARVREAIEGTDRHVPDRHQPDKAVTLIDSAAARARARGLPALDARTQLEVLADQTGRPVQELDGDGREALRSLAARLGRRVMFQGEAIEALARTIATRRLGLAAPERPLATALLAGDTGVGKTETARALADELFGGRLLVIPCGDLTSPGDVSRLVGAPPGYVTSDREPGLVVSWIRRSRSGVILFDELEKAAPEIHRFLLELLDRGRLTARGLVHDLRQCVILATTNAITSADTRRRAAGFGAPETAPADLLARWFRPELLARWDEIAVYRPLGPAERRAILAARLDEALSRAAARGHCLRIDRDALLARLEQAVDHAGEGARAVARVVEREVEHRIAAAVLAGEGEVALG